SAVTVGFSLAIFTLFLIVFINISGVVHQWGEKAHVIVYIKDNSVKGGISELKANLTLLGEVESVTYISKDDALKILNTGFEAGEGLLEGLKENPLPASFEIKLKDSFRDPKLISNFAEKVGSYRWVEEVQFGGEWVEKFAELISFVKLTAVILGTFLIVATLFIISNTIRLTVYARREEIEVMRLVGASNTYIKAPFVIEGVTSGIVGGLIAYVLIYLGIHFLGSQIPSYFELDFQSTLSAPFLLLCLILSGVLLGAIGALVSLGKFLKV
ncbi:MAG: ABC transporter permease, partial [Deltaproteobacteria bacterium]|nr:ABC transporter permease [Deltaproteobacteria bacterium]